MKYLMFHKLDLLTVVEVQIVDMFRACSNWDLTPFQRISYRI